MNTSRQSILNYTIWGIVFGCLFPLLSTIIALHKESLNFSWANILYLHRSNTLLQIIDTAPFFLGIFSFFIGYRTYELLKSRQQFNETMLEAAKNNLVVAQEKNKAILESSTDAVLSFNANQKVDFFNTAAEK